MLIGSTRLVHMPLAVGHMHGKVVHTFGWVVDLGHMYAVVVRIGRVVVVVCIYGVVVEVDSTAKEKNLFLVGFGMDFDDMHWTIRVGGQHVGSILLPLQHAESILRENRIPHATANQFHPPPLPLMSSLTTRHVAVIGAGAAGLVAARELRREEHRVVVFERGEQVGGTWVYTPERESDPLGVDPKSRVVHSSLYDSLRTNLPRECMGDFAAHFGIGEVVRLQTEVVFAGLGEEGKWRVRSRPSNHNRMSSDDGDCVDEIYDALLVCNGHYVQPRIADNIPVVVLIGGAASAVDISRDIATVAKEVHIADRSLNENAIGKLPGHDNMWLHSMIDSVHEDGRVVFRDGDAVGADIIVHCTGYKYDFSFLETNGEVSVDDNRVGPLYKHVFPPALAPWLSFVGLPWKWDYDNWIADQCGIPGVEEWRMEMYKFASKNKRLRPESYRDEWNYNELVLEAQRDFNKYLN
ncbi:hypothetical protein PIB30_074539 [Stylosanthes scabra]|uniref:Flavin-containing monooxygenase n=1 Tax=Stylosanthes scabra TaxID=79078 RepID=A0ABU6XQ17_9FABA|nr:hypothetical protein [Stylosanthes scabra]